jgi:hypothetical protein
MGSDAGPVACSAFVLSGAPAEVVSTANFADDP